ncbi:hypothetical protein BJV85_001368 [Clostridium acetobutylicum]|nr:hypothetical protein [Clostridium acetobutylicum]
MKKITVFFNNMMEFAEGFIERKVSDNLKPYPGVNENREA